MIIYFVKLGRIIEKSNKEKTRGAIEELVTITPEYAYLKVGKDTKKVLRELEDNKIYLSTTTACALGNSPSKSVLAITGSEELASNTLRISISHLTTMDEVNKFIEMFKKITK